MDELKNCSKCGRSAEDCSKEKVLSCLKKSECEYCDNTTYNYPYGRDESRHCSLCGAEWSIWK